MVNFLPLPQFFWYCTLTLVLIDPMVPCWQPVVRPLFATGSPTRGVPGVAHGMPMSRILPVLFMRPERTAARAASTFCVPSGTAWLKSATTVATRQPLSMRPGWVMSSGGVAWSTRARTWLLLRMYGVPPLVTSDRRVPPQQKAWVISLAFPPDDPYDVVRPWWLAPLPSARTRPTNSTAQ